MRLLRGAPLLGAWVALLATAAASEAAWNNVFQVTCHRNRVAVSNFAPECCDPCPQPCPQPVCTTRYVQRCYYQPVTTYKQQVSYQPVTRYRTSYYWEPCTSYRYSCCYDPCTCSYRQVARPVTSYRLRSRCCAVTEYLQRCQLVPETRYRQVTYYQAVTDCQDPCDNVGGVAPSQPSITTDPPPSDRIPPIEDRNKPKVRESRLPDASRFPSVPETREPPIEGGREPRASFDRITSLPRHNVEGRVESDDRGIAPEARLLFVSAERNTEQRAAVANREGRFRASLASGSWLVYVRDDSGRPIYQTKIRVGQDRVQRVSLVRR